MGTFFSRFRLLCQLVFFISLLIHYFAFQATIGNHDKEGCHASHVASPEDYTFRFPLKIQVHLRLSFECLLKIIFSLCMIFPSFVIYVQCSFFFLCRPSTHIVQILLKGKVSSRPCIHHLLKFNGILSFFYKWYSGAA